MPKNIIMIGPTGVGKTEIARRLAKLAEAPFIKVEASKFTEVGYVGRDVESIIRDLTELAINMVKRQQLESVQQKAEQQGEDRLLESALAAGRPRSAAGFSDESTSETEAQAPRNPTSPRDPNCACQFVKASWTNERSNGGEGTRPPRRSDFQRRVALTTWKAISATCWADCFRARKKTADESAGCPQAIDPGRSPEIDRYRGGRHGKRSPRWSRPGLCFWMRSTRSPAVNAPWDRTCREKACSETCFPIVEGCTVTPNMARS